MTGLPVLAIGFFMHVLAVIWVLNAALLILVILIQKGRGGGLSGAFGGGMASNLMGSKTGDFLTWVTISMACLFILLSIFLAKFYKPSVRDMGQPQQTSSQPVQPAPAAPMPQDDMADQQQPQMPMQPALPDEQQ